MIAGAVVGFTLDDCTPLTSESASLDTDDEKVILGDLHGINQGSQNFGVGGYTEQDLTVHSAPLTVNEANFDTPGQGGSGNGCQPAIVRAHSRALALSTIPGNRRRSSTAAASSPP